MAKKTYECDRCDTTFQVDEKEKEPRCPVCSSHALIEIKEEEVNFW